MRQNPVQRKLRIVTTILGVLTAIIMGTLPLLRTIISPDRAVMMLSVGGIFFVLTMVLMIISMLIHPNLLIKLTALPVAYIIVMLGYMLEKLNVYNIFKMMLGVEVPNQEELLSAPTSIVPLSMMLHVGVWVFCIPLIIAAIVKGMKLDKRNRIDFSTFDTGTGTIKNVTDTYTKINHVKVYKVTIEVDFYQGRNYEVTKEFSIHTHMLNMLEIGNKVSLKINPKDENDIYIQSKYGII